MGSFTYSDGVAAWKVVFYPPALVISVFVAARHGFAKSSGWIFLTIFCTVRIVGSVAQLILISQPASHGARTTALVCSVLGLSPLLLSSLGLLARSFYSILKQPWNTIFSLVVLKIVQTPAAIGLILCIIGATSADTPIDIYNKVAVKIGVIMFTVVFVLLCILTCTAALGCRATGKGERPLVVAVAFALPFLLVRILYVLIATFGNSEDIRVGNESAGAVTISLFMETVEECAVVIIYLAAGLKQRSVPIEDPTTGERIMYRFGRGDFGGGKLGLLSLGAAVVGGVAKRRKFPSMGTQAELQGRTPDARDSGDIRGTMHG